MTIRVSPAEAKRRKWEGPYRYRMPDDSAHAGVVHGWIVMRGRKWLHFYSIRDGRKRVPLTEEQYMVKV